jgi:hypothetical protein
MLIALEDVFCEILELACVVINAHMASMLGNSFGYCSVSVVSLPWTTPVSFSEQTLLAVVYIYRCSNVLFSVMNTVLRS